MAHCAKDVDNFSAARTLRIVGVETVENYTVYVIEVALGPYTWTVRHRYSDFHDLHEKLVSTCKLDRSLLPPKKLFGNQSEWFIKKRQSDLEVYIQTVMYFLVSRVPPVLAAFLDFNRYEIHGITQSLAEDLYSRGDLILQAKETFQISPLQIYALTERLKLPEPTCDSGDLKKDLGHILDFITRLKYLKISGTRDPVGTSNMDMNQLKFDLTLFKSLQHLDVLNCNSLMIQGLETVKQTLQKLEIHHSIRAVRDMLLQEFPHWRAEDGSMLITTWDSLTMADFSHNNIIAIDDSVQLLHRVEMLNLGHNLLEGIDHLQWLSHLTHLNLSHNSIRHLDALHTKLGNLKTLNLSANKLESLHGFSKLFSLQVLNVSNNEISQVLELKHISSLPCLESLLLLGNPVTIVPDYRTKVLEIFDDRANEVCLDNQLPSQKELDTVAVRQAIQKARDGKDRHRRAIPKKVVTEVPILEPGPSAQQLSTSQDSTTAVIGWSVTDAQSLSSDPDIFRLQVEAIREQGGDAWLALLNELQASPTHRHQAREYLTSLTSVASPEERIMSSFVHNTSSPFDDRRALTAMAENSVSNVGTNAGRPGSVTDEGFATRSIDQEKLPGIDDREFVSTLQSQLLSVELMFHNHGEEDVEQIRQILWCYAIQYSRPGDKLVACVALTDRHVFIQRLKGVKGRIDSTGVTTTSDTETFYILPFFNIQKVVIGRDWSYVRLEEAFVGPNGTFLFLASDSESVKRFVHALRSLYRGTMGTSGSDALEEPDMTDLSVSGENDLKSVICKTEKIPDPVDVEILHSCPVLVNGDPSCLVLTDHTFYVFKDNCVKCPPPTFEISGLDLSPFELSHRYPVMTRLSSMELFNSSGRGMLEVTSSYSSLGRSTPDSIQYEHYGISLDLEIDDPVTPIQNLELLYLSSKSRDTFLKRFTQLRIDHAEKMSPTHRGEPEGGNESSESETISDRKDSSEIGLLDKDFTVTVLPSNNSSEATQQSDSSAKFLQSNCCSTVVEDCSSDRIDQSQHSYLSSEKVDQSQSSSQTPIQSLESCGTPEITITTEQPNFYSTSNDIKEKSPARRKTARSFTTLELGYPGKKLIQRLTDDVTNYNLIKPLSVKLQFFVKMSGDELVSYFHSNIVEIGFELEELRHAAWGHVVLYNNPRHEILSLILVTTRAVYLLSHEQVKVKHVQAPWMTHSRNKSDSLLSQHTRFQDQHHMSGILHTATKVADKIVRPFKVIPLCDIKLVNVGLFDQYLRLTGRSEESVVTLVTRDCYITEEFLKQLTLVLSLVSASPTPDIGDEPDFYRTFAQRTKSTIEGLEYTHSSKVRFCYPGEEVMSDLIYLVNDSVGGSGKNVTATHVWMYLLGYMYAGHVVTDICSKAEPRGIILTSTHICLLIEDLVSYPLPEFVRGLPECARQEIFEIRKVEYLKMVTVHNGSASTLVFSDETEDILVDASFEHYGAERAVKGRESPPEIVWTLLIQNAREKEKFLQLLGRQWSEAHEGLTMPQTHDTS